MNKKYFILASSLVLFFISCKKGIEGNGETPQPTQASASQLDLLKDSVYLYSKEMYLWPEVIPAYDVFNPRKYTGTTDINSASAIMNGIRALQPLDRFSFVTTKEVSAGLQTGQQVDHGFFVKPASIDVVAPIDSVRWFVSYAYDQSSAGKAGVSRGWFINKINNTKIGYEQASTEILNQTFFGNTNSASFQFVKPDGSLVDLNLNKSSFISNSVLHKSVIEQGGKKIGYFVFNQFFGEPSRTELSNVFSYFKTQGINELVVDLRYNPGGSTQTHDALANLIAPASANNKVMYKYIFGPNLQQNKFPLLQKKTGYSSSSFSEANNTEKFTSAGGLSLSRVLFIVTGSTASASELLINNLKPYMDVKIVGDTTYGKPVGFFPVDVFNYSIYPISFKTVNSAGNADYYFGFAPDKVSSDGVNKGWGDVTEPSLASALKYITTGTFRVSSARMQQEDEKQIQLQELVSPLSKQLEQNSFSGMFIEKH
jgi:C-terminal processing protease CtpA/Prc